MKKLILVFFLLITTFVESQELMNFYLESNGTENSITLHTKVFFSQITCFSSMESSASNNIVTIKLCYLSYASQVLTFDKQEFTLDLPNGYNNYTFEILLYSDGDGGECSYTNLVDTGEINFDFPYIDTATTYMPDDSFEEYIEALYEGDGIDNNDLVLTSRIENITRLYLNGTEPPNITIPIQDSEGIEEFISLRHLSFNNNSISSLDVSNSPNLIRLYCYSNPLNQLDISGNSELEWLWCYFTNLTTIDLSYNTNLIRLDCSNSQINALDLTNNTSLQYLDCQDNILNHLDLSFNSNLIDLRSHNNNLTSIEFSDNSLLESISCDNNALVEVNLSNLSNLKSFSCGNNQLTELNLNNNSLLETFSCLNSSELSYINVQNGNNENITIFLSFMSPNLECIQVDDENASYLQNWYVDSWTQFSEDCSTIGIDEISNNNALELYPNPTTQQLFINNENNTNIISLHIYDAIGKLVIEEYTHFQEINLQTLKLGVYWVQIETENGSITKKVIKL